MAQQETVKIAVSSGKGGTGKTTMAVGLALALGDVQLLDCDVEAPNAHLFLDAVPLRQQRVSVPLPVIDPNLCTACRLCAEVCEFNALAVLKDRVLVFAELCHGCGACVHLCPEQAITEIDRTIGSVEWSRAPGVELIGGRLDPGQPMPTPVIRKVLDNARDDRVVVMDCSPGTSCAVVTTVRGADVCLLVTEPTPLGLHDLKAAVEVCRVLGKPAAVVINRSDIGNDEVEDYCRHEGLAVLLRVPFDRRLAQYYAAGRPLTDALPELSEQLREVARRLVSLASSSTGQEERKA